jgi:RNA polymerase sigma-70 factor (ECF subfamily)
MKSPIVQETRRAGRLRFASGQAYAPPACIPARESTAPPQHVLDPQTLGDHFDRLFRAAWALCGSREDAEDLVQNTYSRILARPRVVRNDDDLGYLLRALRNTFLSERRATERRPRSAGAEPEALNLPDPRTGAEPPAAAEAREVFTAIAALPAAFRDALVAIDVGGLSYKEAANALRVPEGTITTRLYRARSQVAKSLSQSADTSHAPDRRCDGPHPK